MSYIAFDSFVFCAQLLLRSGEASSVLLDADRKKKKKSNRAIPGHKHCSRHNWVVLCSAGLGIFRPLGALPQFRRVRSVIFLPLYLCR